MWLPIIGFCDGVINTDSMFHTIDDKTFSDNIYLDLCHVRSVSVKFAKVGREWYDGYTFEVRVVTDNNFIEKKGHIITFIPESIFAVKRDGNHVDTMVGCKYYLWGNHANYISCTREIKIVECVERYVSIFTGVQTVPPNYDCCYVDYKKVKIEPFHAYHM